MTKSKKLLSVFLAVVMVLSTFTVGFYAIAADDGATEDTAVTDAEASISAFYDNRTYLFTERDPEKHEQAVADYNAATSKVKALSEEQKLDLDRAYYGFLLYYVVQSVARDLNEGSASTEQYVDTTMNHLSDIEAVAGTLPAKYKEVYDIFKTFYGENNITTSTNWKDNAETIAAYETWAKAVAALDADQFDFANYLYPSTGGFYFYNIGTSARSSVLPNIITYEFNIIQDNETEAGKSPSSVSKSTYIQWSYSSKTGTWKADQNGATYLAAWQEYYDLTKSDVVAVSEKTLDFVLELFEPYYDGLTDAVNNIVEVGQTFINDKENADLDEIKAAIEAYNNIDESIKGMATTILGNSTIKLAASMSVPIELDETTDATEAYNNSPSVTTYYGAQLVEQLTAYINEALLNDFIEYVNAVDMDALTDEIIAEVKSQYAQLSDDNKGAIPEETYNKFIQIVSPIKDTTDFADEIAAFQPTAFVRPTNSKVAWTEGGIQNFVDSLENLLGGFVNIGDILSDNLYQVSVLKAVLGLYATLSHDTSEISASGLTFELGEVISWIVTPDTLAAQLEEEKFAGAVEKIGQIEVTEEEAAEGINEYDKLAAIEFTAEDWGFTAGDQEGFIDALLAALRPITVLLDPDAEIKAMGLVSIGIGIKMFDYTIGGDGSYTPGAYEQLLPLLEQLGLNDLPTAAAYKENYYAVKEASGANIAADEFLRPIIESLFTNIVEPLAANPVNTLVDVLPRLAYVVDGDRLNTVVKGALSQFGLLSGLAGSLDLSTAAINNMIPDTIDIGALIGDGTELVLNIGDLPWTTLANCATLSAVPSKSIYNENVLLRTGDADSCFSTVFYWLFDVALADADTYAALKDLIVGLVPDNLTSIINTVIAQVLDPIVAAGKIDGYGLLLDNIFIGAQPTGNEIWRVEAAAGQGGAIDPAGTVEVKQADSKTFTITADAGYTIDSLTVNGQAVAAAAGKTAYEYTVNGADVTSADAANQNVTDVTISVVFADESGEPAPGPDTDPSDPTDPTDPTDPSNPDGGSNTGDNNNNGGKLPSVNNPNLPNTGAAEIAGMGVLTVVIAIAVGAAVWFILKKRIVKD